MLHGRPCLQRLSGMCSQVFGLLYFSSIKPEWAMGNDDRVSFTNRRFMTGFHSQEEDFWVAFKQSGWGKRIYFLFFAKKNMF